MSNPNDSNVAMQQHPRNAASRQFRTVFGRLTSTVFAVGSVVGVVVGVAMLGHGTGWRLPKASALRGESVVEVVDWCPEHGVPESTCVECHPERFPPVASFKACRDHGVANCPLCHPEVAQLPSLPVVTAKDRDRAAVALALHSQDSNDLSCRKHERRIQLATGEMANRLGLNVVSAFRSPVAEIARTTGEITYDPTRVARLTPRAGGTVAKVYRQTGDRVRAGDVIALIDSAEVGKAKAEFQQALVQRELKQESLAKLKPGAGTTVPAKDVQTAEAALAESEVRLLTAEQVLANLGMPITADDLRGLAPAALVARMQYLGLPGAISKTIAAQTTSSNLLPVMVPFDGEVVAGSAVAGGPADSTKPLFTVVDTSRMWLTLRVRPEDANRMRPGQPVRFRHTGHVGPSEWDMGTAVWISPAADEKTRTVPVRVNLSNPSDRHHANTFGTAEVVMRNEPQAVVVPAEAVHWEGCCHIVFVRDKDYEKADAAKVFHVRKVRLGVKDVPTATGPVTEIIVGVLPGEQVATTNSSVLRAQLLKNDLGEG